jgi:putative tryptophan/tyrosine transport system substrate-binding protein
MDRRTFISTVACSVIATPLIAQAQQPALPVVGFLSSRSPEESAPHAAAFRRGLSEIGYVEGQNIAIDYRWANGHYERLPGLARELVRLGVNALVAVGGTPSALAAKSATATIPIVFLIGDDPAKIGLVASFNRPGGNLTGVTFVTSELGAKRLGLLYELVPNAGVSAFLLNPNFQEAGSQAQDMQAAAHSLGWRLLVLRASTETELASSFAMLSREHVGALVVENDPFFDSQRSRLIALAARNAIPAIYHIREFPAAGGLMSYGASLVDAYRQVGTYAGRILKGTNPADLPVEQPTTFELVINMKTAKALGLTIPQSLRVQAELIE